MAARLLMAEGPEYSAPEGLFYSPLGAIAPAGADLGRRVEHAVPAEHSELGLRHPVTRGLISPDEGQNAARLGPLVSARSARRRPAGQTVMTGPGGKPLLVLSRVDKGRVGLLLSDQMWLWARGYDGGGPYLDLLRRLAHWLMKEPELEEEALRASARGRDDHCRAAERRAASSRSTRLTGPGGLKTQSTRRSRRACRGRRSTSTGSDFIAPATASMSRSSTSAPRTRSKCAKSSRRRRSCARLPRRPAEPCAGSPTGVGRRRERPARRRAQPCAELRRRRLYRRQADRVERTDRRRARRSLASGFFGLALLLGAVVLGWRREAGRFDRRRRHKSDRWRPCALARAPV